MFCLAWTIDVGFEIRIPDLTGRGELAFLQLDVSDEDADANPNNSGQDADGDGREPGAFIAALTLDILDPIQDPEDPHDDFKLRTTDIEEIFTGDLDIADMFSLDLVGRALLNLDLLVSFEGDARFPSIGSEFTVDWTFSGSSLGGSGRSRPMP